MSAPAWKAEYAPMAEMIITKKVKKKNDINALSMGAPLGMMPAGVSKDVAIEFVKVYIKAVQKHMKAEKIKYNMLHLRTFLKKESGLGATPAPAAAAPAAAAPAPAVAAAPPAQALVPGLKPEYGPLIKVALNRKMVHKKADLKALSMGPPMGLLPGGVEKDVAIEFVKEFIPAMWKLLKAEGTKGTMTNLRKKLKGGLEALNPKASGPAAAGKAGAGGAHTPAAASAGGKRRGAPSGSAKELRDKGLKPEVIDHLFSAFGMMLGADTSNQLSRNDLKDFYGKLGQTFADEELEYIVKVFTDGQSAESVGFDDFAGAMYNNMGRTEVYGDVFDMCVKGDHMTMSELEHMMQVIGEVASQKELTQILQKADTREKFVKYWGDTLHDAIAPKPPPAPPNPRGGGAAPAVQKAAGGGGAPASAAAAAAPAAGGGGGGGGGAAKNPAYKKFLMMKKCHIPKGAIIQKMKSDNVPQADIDQISKLL